MLDTLRIAKLVVRLAGVIPGAALHRAGLRALHGGDWDAADHLLEHAVLRYRRELRVEAIARARVHQLIARTRRRASPDAASCLEVERLMYRLPRIERLEPPFDLVDARELLATWSAALPADRWRDGRSGAADPAALERAA